MQQARRAPASPVTMVLIVANMLFFLYEIYLGGAGIILNGYSGPDPGVIIPYDVLHYGQWWRIVTGAFLHDGLLHIAVNMFSLWVLGRFVETFAGSFRMAAIYAISLLGSGLAVVYFSAPTSDTLGASGAIFGLFGALFAIGLKLGKPGMEMVKANLGLLVINLVITFWVPNIAVWAHVGGLVIGFIATYLIYYPPAPVRAHVVDAQTGEAIASEYESPAR